VRIPAPWLHDGEFGLLLTSGRLEPADPELASRAARPRAWPRPTKGVSPSSRQVIKASDNAPGCVRVIWTCQFDRRRLCDPGPQGRPRNYFISLPEDDPRRRRSASATQIGAMVVPGEIFLQDRRVPLQSTRPTDPGRTCPPELRELRKASRLAAATANAIHGGHEHQRADTCAPAHHGERTTPRSTITPGRARRTTTSSAAVQRQKGEGPHMGMAQTSWCSSSEVGADYGAGLKATREA